MILADGVFALAIAFFLTVIFVVLGRRARSWHRIIIFFVLVFLAAWAGGVWIGPVGPAILGVYWLSFFVVGLIFALLQEALAAFAKRAVPREPVSVTEAKEEHELENVFDVFLLILLVVFIAAIIIGYVHRLK
jgi:hypothetical protein